MDDGYIDPTAVTRVKIFRSGDDTRWCIDGRDKHNRYTEACAAFETFVEAVANLKTFVEVHFPHLAMPPQGGG